MSKYTVKRQTQTKNILESITFDKVSRIFDVGAGDTVITASLLDLTGADEAYATDLHPPKKRNSRITFVPLDNLQTLDTDVDMVTTMMSIHHFTCPETMFTRINRLLPIDGLLLIKEHDTYSDPCKREQHLAYLELLHIIYAVIKNESMPDELNIRTSSELTRELAQYGFSLVQKVEPDPDDLQLKYGALYRKDFEVGESENEHTHITRPLKVANRFKKIDSSQRDAAILLIYNLLGKVVSMKALSGIISRSSDSDVNIIANIKAEFSRKIEV